MSEFSIYATPLPGHDLADVESQIDAIITEVVSDGVTEAELESAKDRLIKSTIFERDNQTAMARLYGTVLATGGTIEDVTQWPERIGEVTLEDVNAAARKYLQPNRSVTGYLTGKET